MHLVDVCRTRWVVCIDRLRLTAELYPVIVATLKIIQDNDGGTWNDKSTQKAVNIYRSVDTFEFVISLIVLSRYLEVTRPLTKQLQTASYDAGATKDKISLLYIMLEKMCLDVDERHDSWV